MIKELRWITKLFQRDISFHFFKNKRGYRKIFTNLNIAWLNFSLKLKIIKMIKIETSGHYLNKNSTFTFWIITREAIRLKYLNLLISDI